MPLYTVASFINKGQIIIQEIKPHFVFDVSISVDGEVRIKGEEDIKDVAPFLPQLSLKLQVWLKVRLINVMFLTRLW